MSPALDGGLRTTGPPLVSHLRTLGKSGELHVTRTQARDEGLGQTQRDQGIDLPRIPYWG